MKRVITRLLADYGSVVTYKKGGFTYAYNAFLQLVTSKSWQNMERMIPECGEILRGQYLYIGPPHIRLLSGDCIRMDGRDFLVRRANDIYFQNERLFVWGLCVERGAAA